MRKERTPLYRSIVEKGGSPCYVFNAGTYEAGELVAEGIVDGKVVATHSVRTPEQPRQVKIWLKEENIQPVADGSDMIPVYFKVCDSMVLLSIHRMSKYIFPYPVREV